MSDNLLIEKNEKVWEITLNKPPANAISAAFSRELGEAFGAFRDDATALVCIVTGAGEKIFSAGWDLKAAATEGAHEGEDMGQGGFAGLTEMFNLKKPVIAAVNGTAVGGGFELALACDLILAAEHALFFLPETAVGVAADAGGIQRLPRRIPYHVAMDMLLTGRRMGAEEAARWGLVKEVVPAAELMDKARALANEIAAGAPLSVMAIKEVLTGTENMSLQEAFASTRNRIFPVYDKMLDSEDHLEGPRAFAEKREPVWKGR